MKPPDRRPPRVAEALLGLSLPGDVRDAALGDMAEAYRQLARKRDPVSARYWYWSQTVRSLNPVLRWPMRFASPLQRIRPAPRRHRGGWMGSVLQDIRFGLRAAQRNLGSTLVIVLTLGVGIGANTAIFSVVDGILLRPLPYPEPERLVTVWADYTQRSGPLREWLSYANFHDLRRETAVFEEVAVWSNWNPTLTGLGEAELLTGGMLSEGMFSRVLGIQPAIGRSFVPADDKPGAANVALISHRFWTRRFAGEAKVLGRAIVLSGVSYNVIGVMPAGFRPPFAPNAELWRPYQIDGDNFTGGRGNASFRSFGRIRQGVTLAAVRTRANALGSRLQQDFPQDNTGVGYAIFPLRSDLVRQAQAPLWVLLGAVGFVLLIACVNVANLLLARMHARQSELAVRAALGAEGRRLLRQLFTESAMLALLGGALGVALAFVGTDALVALAPSGIPRIDGVTVDLRILLFAGGVTALSTFVFGLLPALRGSRTDLHEALKVGGRGMEASAGGRAMGSVLVMGQVALALMLLVGAGLMIRSLRALNAVDLGFEPRGMLTLTLNLPQTRYPDRAASAAFFRDLETRLGALPGVDAVGSTNTVPLSGLDGDVNFDIEGRSIQRPGEENILWLRRVTPTYFETIGIRIVRGRAFTPSEDREAPRVIIVNETLAERYFPGEDAIGKRININDPENVTWREIVGIAEDVKNFGIQRVSRNAAYFPFAQLPTSFMAIVMRTAGDPTLLIPSARNVIAEMDPSLAASNVTTMESMVQASLGSERFVTMLLTIFASVALVLATVGLYGVVSYSVSRRVREMGIRVALGAADGDIRKLIVGKSVGMAVAGVGVGVVGALLLTRLMEGLLFGVPASDPVTFATAAVLLTAVAAVASAIPAQRAVKVDPMAVLKNE